MVVGCMGAKATITLQEEWVLQHGDILVIHADPTVSFNQLKVQSFGGGPIWIAPAEGEKYLKQGIHSRDSLNVRVQKFWNKVVINTIKLPLKDIQVHKTQRTAKTLLREKGFPARPVFICWCNETEEPKNAQYSDIMASPLPPKACLARTVQLITRRTQSHEDWKERASNNPAHYSEEGLYSMQLADAMMRTEGWQKTTLESATVQINTGYVTTSGLAPEGHAWHKVRVQEEWYTVDVIDGRLYMHPTTRS